MKKLFTLFAAILVCSLQSVKATDVAGHITSNTTWNAAGSPYIVTSSVYVDDGFILTVQAGVTVKFNDSQALYVYGTMNATNAIFTSNNANPTPGIWYTIQAGGSSGAGTVTMSGCQVLYASTFLVYKKAILSTTDLLNFSSHCVNVQGTARFKMTGGNINTNSASAAASYAGILGNGNSFDTISGVTIQHFQYGISLNTNDVFDVTNLTITNCNKPIYYTNSAHLIVHGTNTFTGNVFTCVYMGFSNFSDTLTLPVLNIPYYFPSWMTVNTGGRLIIGSNNILKFQNWAGLDVNGSMSAEAISGEFIYFTSIRDDNWGGDTNNDGTATAPAQSDWVGIRFQDPSIDAACLMRRCKVRYAGAGSVGGISMFNASPTIDLCDLSNNYYGVYMQYASNPVFSNNTIGSSYWTPIAMSFEANPTMPNNVLSFSDNRYDAIGLIGGTLTANSVVKKRSVTTVQNITYLMLDQIIVPAGMTMTINKGIVIKSYSNSHRIIVNGTLNATATADSMITFTSSKDDNFGNPGDSNKDGTITSPAIGDWGGIIFNPASTGTLNYCRIKYATNWDYSFISCSTTEWLNLAGVGMIDASPVISNCEFKDLNYGISCYRASNPTISNNSMINITYTPFCISGSSDPVFTGNTFTNVTWRAIGLLGGYVCQNGTIRKRDISGYTNITYVLLGNMTINSGTSVNVEPGVVIKVNGCNLYVDGGFKTDGIAGQNVMFTSLKDDNEGNPFDTNGDGNATSPNWGDWGTIKFRATSDDSYCKINYTMVKYAAGMWPSEGSIAFENAGGQINNSTITNSYNFGIYSNGNSTPAVNNVTIQNCRLDPLAMSLLSNPTYTNIVFAANGSKAIRIIEGTLSSDAILATRDVAGISNIAYIIDRLDISSNAKLTIQPGVVIKFRDDDNYGTGINVLGKLVAKGLQGNKIYFTSYADDSKGGDSNNNGNSTVPSRGDWGLSSGGIIFSNTVNDTMTCCEISYPNNGMYFGNTQAVIDNCVIQQVSYYGINIIGSSDPAISNCQFNNISYSPIRLSMFSNPSFTNCTSLNVGRMALTVAAETYAQNATVPVRNFGGYTNITYFMEGTCTINSGTTITIPAGIVFKSGVYTNEQSVAMNGFIVNGRLNILGSAGSKVIFTESRDDEVGNPPDMNQDGSATHPPDGISYYQQWQGTWLTFNDVSNDSSEIQHATFKYANTGISLTSASPTINQVRFEKDHTGVDLNGVSQPVVDNCTFHDLLYYPLQISLVSFPSSITNNLISGRTYKVIKVRDETLTQDVSLEKRSFGGISNIPYFFTYYTIGTGATLTVKPGVVCKFKNGWLTVNKGLIAEGGFRADSNIVFTDYRDDFYGGDSNSDTARTIPQRGWWSGLTFNDQSLDPLCRLRNCIVKYANYGIQTVSASPTVTKSTIAMNNYGVYATAASNPVFSYCDFDDNCYWAIDNVNKSFVIDARNCWWGSNLGPIQTDTQGNCTSAQELVTTAVNYTPFRTTGAADPVMGDVSLNGLVQAYDASLVLQHVVGSITLSALQQQVADVSGTAGITAYDASLILQYVVGLIQNFPAELSRPVSPPETESQLIVGSAEVVTGNDVTVPLRVVNNVGMFSSDITIQYDPVYLSVVQVTGALPDLNTVFHNDSINGLLSIAVAGTIPLDADTTLALVTFHASSPAGGTVTTNLNAGKFYANEFDLTTGTVPGVITILDKPTAIRDNSGNEKGGLLAVFPNPSTGNATITYQVIADEQMVVIELFDLVGQKVAILVNEIQCTGKYTIAVRGNGKVLDPGAYLIRLTMDNYSQTRKFQVVR